MDKNFGNELRQLAQSYNAPQARLTDLERMAKTLVEEEILNIAKYKASVGKFSFDLLDANRKYSGPTPTYPSRKEAQAAIDQLNGFFKKYLAEYGLSMIFLRGKCYNLGKMFSGPNGEKWHISFDIMGISW